MIVSFELPGRVVTNYEVRDPRMSIQQVLNEIKYPRAEVSKCFTMELRVKSDQRRLSPQFVIGHVLSDGDVVIDVKVNKIPILAPRTH